MFAAVCALLVWLIFAVSVRYGEPRPPAGPEQQAAGARTAAAEDRHDEELFIWREAEGGVCITGLTEAARTRTALTLPAGIAGKPVTGFDPAVFAGNTVIEELTLQGNISFIGDGSFDGCTALRSIILPDIRPSACEVGGGLLRGCGALIAVPPERYPLFQTSYFWARYAGRIRPAGTETEAYAEALTEESPAARAESCMTYDANGGQLIGDENSFTLTRPVSTSHLRTNTLQGTRYFTRPGYLQIAWNTRADGSGENIGLGSRYALKNGDTLYAVWLPVTPEEEFDWEASGGQIRITAYHGTGDCIVIPLTLDGMPVRSVAANAFRDAQAGTVVLSWNLRRVEDGAFAGCAVENLYLFDSLMQISDSCFAGCGRLKALHVNAVTSPRYSTSYFAAFADKYDRLLSLRGTEKLVLFSGSSTRYAYSSGMFREAFPACEPVNMGVYAYTNALPQLDLILRHMEPGDTLLHAPEFDTLHTQFCEERVLDLNFWAMMEADYDAAGELFLPDYEGVFDSLGRYFATRGFMPVLDYEDSPDGFDDDGNRREASTYNEYGDFILRREGIPEEKLLQNTRAPYTPDAFPPGRLEALNRVYRRFQDKGVCVLFTFTPRNRCSLTEESTPEERAALERLLRDTLCAPLILPVEESLLPARYFWLIDSHLSTEGAEIYTGMMIRALEPWMEKP